MHFFRIGGSSNSTANGEKQLQKSNDIESVGGKDGKKKGKQHKIDKAKDLIEDAFKADLDDDPASLGSSAVLQHDIKTKHMPGYSPSQMQSSSASPSITSNNQIQLSHVVSKHEVTDPHFEAMSTKATLLEIKRSKLERKVKNIAAQTSKSHIDLDKLKNLAWSGIPKSKSLHP